MHNIIYQISSEPISEKAFIGTDNIENGDMVSIDYAYDTKAEERSEFITALAEEVLPKGMFTVNADGETLTYQGGFAEWRKTYLALIRTKAADINAENIMEWIGPTFQLQKAIVNPLCTDALFVTDFAAGYALAERSREFMAMVSRMHKGDTLHIGAIVGYHF